ncbi:PspA/IM30 family protein [Enterovirga rhinocerotis]|uniref:Phage shock protein A (PspA) family protein n=1 Tax=Enterovirga rhinocerotis TaxID=1339210 RepID=A0A4R7BNF2_9HYPH|nr:PspA/IM30 family protein [Enterovirga rhinocerotis]TDR85466.1 phage shock protein A (PspA) family protein [Enterovirga rhinocerotis]
MHDGAPATLLYVLAPDDGARRALDATFEAYAAMARILAGMPEAGGRNLVTLHERAYERIREETGLPARLVTLGLRDLPARAAASAPDSLPLDEKLFAIKGPATLTVSTVFGRVAVPYDVAGYAAGRETVFPARLVLREGRYEIHVAVVRRAAQLREETMQEGVLSRMGRLIAGIANATIDKVEDVNKVAVVEQAIREIDQAADQARTELGKAKAEEYRVKSRKAEIGADLASLGEKLKLAIAESRDDLAKAAIARQIDLEAQVTALDRTLADVRSEIDEGQQALQAVLATRREAETRLADLKRSLAQHAPSEPGSGRGRRGAADGSAKAAAAIARVTGVPAGASGANAELDELDRLHRERVIAERLALAKGSG